VNAARVIVLEGPDGAGKTTVSRAVESALRERGIDCVRFAFPGRDAQTIGEHVYELHHDPARFGIRGLTPLALQTLHVAAHVEAIDTQIRPAFARGATIILDRCWWSTWVYGLAEGVSRARVRALLSFENRVWDDIGPTCVILLRRLGTAEHLAKLYEQCLAEHPANAHAVSNDGGLDETVHRVCELGLRSPELPVASPQLSIPMESAPHLNGRPVRAVASSTAAPFIFTTLEPAKTTVVYDTYWRFAHERQQIFHRRVRGEPAPWTTDAILFKHKFTNAYRASDRVSQFLLQNVIYAKNWAWRDEFLRIVLFKLFNKISTWEALVALVGEPTCETFKFAVYDRALASIKKRGAIYSAAYIMPSGSSVFGYSQKHQTHLRLLEQMLEERLPERLFESRSLKAAFALLRAIPTFGDFLAYQYLIDLNYGRHLSFSEMEFIVPGPGARDGIRKCFSDLGGLSESDAIKVVTDRQEREFERLELPFESLWGRRLHLIDCQNLFCEVDKYARVKHPDVQGLSGRSRIKQLFSPNSSRLRVFYPEKWGLNDQITLKVPMASKQERAPHSRSRK
jgi:thymidylate kinase